MWIAKPIQKATQRELDLSQTWSDPPLAQTLPWQRAAEASGAQTYLISHDSGSWGGFVHSFDEQHFECVNGPLLNWDHPKEAPAHLATFAQAVSQLSKQFQSMQLSPRWYTGSLANRLSLLPIEPTSIQVASTLEIPIEQSIEHQMCMASSRLRRTIDRALKAEVQTQWLNLNPELLDEFVTEMTQFSLKKGFYTPPHDWFHALVFSKPGQSSIEFKIAEAWTYDHLGRQSVSRLLIGQSPKAWHYLFGYDKKESNLSISTSAVAHFRVLDEAIRQGVQIYDLNGFLENPDSDHPYAGVSEFKSQFGGKIIRYSCPQFCIA